MLECGRLERALDNAAFREQLLEERLEEVLLARHEQPSTVCAPIRIEEPHPLLEELRFYKNCLAQKSCVFDQMEQMLENSQEDMAQLV